METQDHAISHERTPEGLVVRIRGRFDRAAGVDIEAVLADTAKAGDVVVLSLEGVEYISSSGVASLVKLSAGQGIRIAAAPQCVMHTIGLAGIEKILHLYASEATALQGVGDGSPPGGL